LVSVGRSRSVAQRKDARGSRSIRGAAFTAATCVTVNPLTPVPNRSEMPAERQYAGKTIGDHHKQTTA
jgi:hypothetical protein